MAYTLASAGNIYPTGGSNPTDPYSGTFIPEIWSGKLVEKFYDATVLAAIANTDYEGEIKNYGDTINIRQRPTITINDYQANQDLDIERPSEPKLQMLIDQGKYFNVILDDVMEVQADIDQMSIWAEDASEQMKITVDNDVLAYLTSGTGFTELAADAFGAFNVGNSAGRISQNIRLGNDVATEQTFINSVLDGNGDGTDNSNDRAVIDYIVDCGQVLDENNVPESGRWMVIPAWMAAMIKRSDLKDASLAGDGTSILRNGRLGMIDRFTLYVSNLLPAGATVTTATSIMFGTSAAFSFAAQFTNMETIRSERTFGNLLRGLQVYGRKVVLPRAIGVGFVQPG